MTQTIREYWIHKNGQLATDLGFGSVLGYSLLCEELKKLKREQPGHNWTYQRGDRYRIYEGGRTKNIDE